MKIKDQYIKEALLYGKLKNKKVRCNTCNRRCIILPGKLGFCKTRENKDGKLYTLEYGLISSINVNPIEKKPLFHFWPGSDCLTIGSWSCTFTCPWCQNYDISKVEPNIENSTILTPEELVNLTVKEKCQGVSASFSEPTTFLEYSLDVFKLAKKRNLYTNFITNGYFTPEALKLLLKSGCDAFNIDIKGDKEAVRKYCGADVEFVWQNTIEARKKGAWVELTTLIILGINDDEECLRGIAKRIHDEVGDSTPWHVSRYYPCYKFTVSPTPVEALEKAFKIGKEEGLKFIYVGNVPGHKENTYCPSCGKVLIERFGFNVLSFNLTKENKCPECGEKIPIVGKFIKRERIW
ncbi:MAG: AmmeMemoRadiSam system radical SAM enzyme [Candidatus Aenigmarchaeota archaeon]|nr:AmmeMemoRadiSam system radical SAM enzyme [Candidatus Aenigmarchaeota archaeon]